ncbi:MAG: hypothetical protein JXP73_19540 [Deltaproteobacteria bacterium]|nr:hypothetical protein [Deltaproteobacteria bacterium]
MHRGIALGIGVIMVSLVAQAKPRTPPPARDGICLQCDDVAPTAVRDKHLAGRQGKPSNPRGCKLDCVFDGSPKVTIGASCRKEEEEKRHAAIPSDGKPVAGLEDRGHSVEWLGKRIVGFVDKDTPCSILVHWDAADTGAEAKAIALARDVAKVLTPAVVAKRQTVEAVVWAEDKTGKKSQAALASWEKEAAALRDLGTFAPGFPKAIDHKDKPGLPEGKKSLLLGYCANAKAEEMVNYFKGALPGLAWHRVSAEGTTIACPTAAREYGPGSVVTKKTKVGKDDLFVVAFIAYAPSPADSPTNRGGFLAVCAYLRDRNGRLIASQQQHYTGPTNDFSIPKIKAADGGLVVQMAVSMGQYPQCKIRPTYPVTERVAVADGKVTITETEGPRPFCSCCGGE